MSRQADVVVVGSINADYLMRVSRRPRGGETVTGGVLEHYMGGKGANQAVAAARAGAVTALVGCVGDDADGRVALDRLLREGVDVAEVRTSTDAATGLAFIMLTPDGENSIAVAPGANLRLGAADAERASVALRHASVVVSQLEIPLAVVERAVSLVGRATRVVVNCAPYRPLPAALLRRVDILVANAHEAEMLAGQDLGNSSAEEVAEAIRGRGPRAVVVTLGGDGAVLASPSGRRHIPAEKVDVIDTTGSGDAFVGAFAAALARGATLEKATSLGVRAGTATAQSVGPVPRVPGSEAVGSDGRRRAASPAGVPGSRPAGDV